MAERSPSLLDRAAAGELPAWAEVSPARYQHLSRVGRLMAEWAAGLDCTEAQRVRWHATGCLHDALRDAPVEHLLPWVPERFRELPVSFWHGPATASRLEAEGLDDAELCGAIRYHTLGHASLRTLGRALIAADFLEPGRPQQAEWRAGLRARMPRDLPGVLREVLRFKITRSLDGGYPIPAETVGAWNALLSDAQQGTG